jgi:hypothetical protein
MWMPGVRVQVTNHGPESLRDVVIHVTGASYVLGEVPPAGSRRIGVHPRSESHVEIEFTDGQGKRVRLNAGGYFEPGDRGDVLIDLRNGQVESVQGQPPPRMY